MAGTEYEVKRVTLYLSKRLVAGDKSKSGLYAIVSKNGVILRVSLFKEIAELLCDYDSRYLHEVFISEVGPVAQR